MEPQKPPDNAPSYYDSSLYRRLIIRPVAQRIAPLLVALGFTGNGVCWVKLAVGLAGAYLLIYTQISVCLLGVLLLQFNFLLDAADGVVARLTGNAGKLSGEYFDKLCDHLPKTAMYFCWGYGTYLLTQQPVALFCGFFFAAWNIYPRFCGVETLLERLDKMPEVQQNPAFHTAVADSFVTVKQRGVADYWLTVFVHPAVNALTIAYILELIRPELVVANFTISTRYFLLLVYTLIGLLNFLRKSLRFFRMLRFP
ncbi:MAG: CDP-alcohol phosphatidyltransferase family protein [bacterium]